MRCIALFFLLLSCASAPRYFLLTNQDQIKGLTLADYNSHIKKGLKAWKKRHDRAELEAFIRHFELCARSTEDLNSQIISRYKIYELLSRAYYLLGNNHEEELSLQKKHWQTGAYWAEKGLYTNETFKKGVGRYGEYASALKFLTEKELGSIYWYLANIGKWAKNSGVGTSIKYIRLIKSMIKKVDKHDPNFYYGGLPRFWGAYYAVIPSFAGGDLNKSKRYFLKSLNINPHYLGTKVLYASLYAVKARDKELFKRLLSEVIKADARKINGIISENMMEQKIAKRMLSQIDEIF